MADAFCPICTGVVGYSVPDWFEDELAPHAQVVPKLRELCFECAHNIVSRIPAEDQEPYRYLRLATENDIGLYAAMKLREIATRVGRGKSPYRCEALVGVFGPQQCVRFQDYQTPEGRRVCVWCYKRGLKGGDLAFIGSVDVPPRAIVVWARNEQECLDRALERWRSAS